MPSHGILPIRVNTGGTFPHPRFEKHLQAEGLSDTQCRRSVALPSLSHAQSRIYRPLYRGPRPHGLRHVNSPHIAIASPRVPHTGSQLATHVRSQWHSCPDSQSRAGSPTESHTPPHDCSRSQTASPLTCSTLSAGLPVAHCPTASHLVSRSAPTSTHPVPQLGSSCSESLLFLLFFVFLSSFSL